MTKPVFFLMGPTASGKTALAIDLIQQFPLEIISVDSALIYRDMNIGTAKPTPAELAIAPHHLIDIVDPTQHYSAGHFVKDATALIDDIHARGKFPLLVGGTMLYFKALQQGLANLPEQDPKMRSDIEEKAKLVGWPQLHSELAQVDPISAAKIKPTDAQRIQRALEVFYLTGKPLSSFHMNHLSPSGRGQESEAFAGKGGKSALLPLSDISEFHSEISVSPTRGETNKFIPLALFPKDRIILHERIAKRVYNMLDAGFVEEVIALRQKYALHANLPSMRAVGYRQVWDYLEGKISKEELPDRILFATRQYAKRQLTWLKSWPHVQYFDLDETLKIETLIKHNLS